MVKIRLESLRSFCELTVRDTGKTEENSFVEHQNSKEHNQFDIRLSHKVAFYQKCGRY